MILGVRACLSLSGITSRTRQTQNDGALPRRLSPLGHHIAASMPGRPAEAGSGPRRTETGSGAMPLLSWNGEVPASEHQKRGAEPLELARGQHDAARVAAATSRMVGASTLVIGFQRSWRVVSWSAWMSPVGGGSAVPWWPT